MGCCFSVSREPHDSNGQTPTEEHSSAIAPPSHIPSSSRQSRQRHLTHNPSPSSSHHDRQRQQQQAVPLQQHINAPIRPHIWHSKKRLWTRALLDRERTEFFETRVTGRPEVWDALSAALQFMRNGDYETAQSIIDAAGVTVPTGDLCQGVYDEQGVLYRLPRCIVSDPVNIVVGDVGLGGSGSGSGSDSEGSDGGADDDLGFETDENEHGDRKVGYVREGEGVESGDELIKNGAGARARVLARSADDEASIERERERRRDEKGKTSERDLIRVKTRLSDRDGADVIVALRKTQNVGFLARKLQQEVGIPRTQRIRIAYLGKILKEHKTLFDQGWQPGHVVNALVVARRSSSSQ
ncbi:hypothetical protein AN1173.2 [Aspergillus nidulans FGSC A4]|uniref:Ubiquitin domain protein, putative (AFU_orthologue AFUA_1G11060) n=1 Tax=Emericella nidulans (strain FGSC A4 / ATCC 38163 / CBS 112.46 / NRRL 194 / M139) TaxID=227321 RepID=Q5BE57_EMENI|nr:hypothetical protein [Aspergillus nidulans FGSC A4]EAA66291.1 hypothetical protein AN1173.2 [Aspergillus nidulans FGSC A4]CBF87999.1 TPA: ubiquitin domain protein, putative (AFU_orthologue; AFUA_1G11060) [Aspergillus nidulans FGSC A4]|eukprot:XP_658777.1 hypothetical protein AN1173.2 [Aspergillus nidulans FGSC A4]